MTEKSTYEGLEKRIHTFAKLKNAKNADVCYFVGLPPMLNGEPTGFWE